MKAFAADRSHLRLPPCSTFNPCHPGAMPAGEGPQEAQDVNLKLAASMLFGR